MARREPNGPTRPRRLRIDIDRWADRVSEKARLRFVSICLEGHAKVVDKSPVDTGFFRASWGVSINENPPPATVQRPAAYAEGTGGEAVATMMARLGGAQLGDVVWIFNPVVYGPALEHGHSQQAPLGIVSVTFQELAAKYRSRRA